MIITWLHKKKKKKKKRYSYTFILYYKILFIANEFRLEYYLSRRYFNHTYYINSAIIKINT
jgi:hypothetical protein